MAIWLDRLGIEATPAEMLEMLAGVKAESLQTKALLDEDQFRAIVELVKPGCFAGLGETTARR